VFTRNEYKNILVENLKYCQENKALEIFAWCVMANNNPVEKRLVFKPEDYVYSGAIDYAGEKELLDVLVIK